ncbi:MAG: hypothetical protein A2900_03085 [Candidatus Chisholmbacteria bacterium RIFCSPLOWO2_01_FULL_50_28]|uniref:Methyltransferase type 11 domain-containing protein n=1 Tax=Candidatus Chisholmbacteria bacterium RIFCSPHIGHO2_01_FULL_52_32 TaxID=1797591 RepID=A0A1G1VT49_9BACT|nr:MAG: hypothetical protein A2786_03660 [Candidatus Chisholmbacteria bacterium RIFCSPHIGHO2_01_FULL_52_32]OGY20060.1 MAG: hypothetical protein A2900_03085 [Candidatus Chisholmbacteria bacterium RIFCSPLOWO2_01_FULL_50_28]
MSRCYLCHQNFLTKAFDKLGWPILRCGNCGLYTLEFKGSYQKFIREYYNKGFFTGSPKRAGYYNYEGDWLAEELNMRSYVKGIRQFKKEGKVLDVGCATGIFMVEAQKEGFDVYGVDVSDYAIGIARRRFSDRVTMSSIERATFEKNAFDIVTLFDVIEHLNDPRKVLKKLHTIIRKDGLLVLNTGDTGSFLAKIQGKRWHFFIPPQHFFYFSQKNLSQLLTQCGFRVLGIDHKGKWITLRYFFHLARQIQQDPVSKFGFSVFGKIAPGKIPIYINLFDNITVYASKTPNTEDASNR